MNDKRSKAPVVPDVEKEKRERWHNIYTFNPNKKISRTFCIQCTVSGKEKKKSPTSFDTTCKAITKI